MSLPPGFLEELRNRTSLASVIGRKVVWDNRKSIPAKGDMWAPCPFHQEKTASFHVDDRKGFYYCFGCHAKGDAIRFVQETENVGFMEAIEILAGEAGMQMPAKDPAAAKAHQARNELVEIMEAAVKFYRMQLASGAANDARAYLDQRGLTAETQARFELGFASPIKDALFRHLTSKGFDATKIEKAGLCYPPKDGMAAADRFRNRIMFPIRDARDRAIAFGARAMDPNDKAKYLNSSETPLFDKGKSLYHIGPARAASVKTDSVIVAEGYMDVIALAQAGFDHAVAPLGTAITEHQLQMIWRFCPEPILALDGDRAGKQAAERAADLALPLLEPGKSLRFVMLPEGQDPDDLIRAQGPEAMNKLLEGARPMIDVLWARAIRGRNLDSPERRAAFDKDLRALLGQIQHPSLRRHYTDTIQQKRRELFRPRWTPNRGRRATALTPRPEALSAAAALETDPGGERIRESAILYGCLNHPIVAADLESELERTPFTCEDLAQMRDAILFSLPDALNEPEADQTRSLNAAVETQLGYNPLTRLQEIGQIRISPHFAPKSPSATVRQALLEATARQTALVGAVLEMREAEDELQAEADEGVTWRLLQANTARDRSARGGMTGDSGEKDEAGLSKLLHSFLEDEIWIKKKR